MSLSRIAELNSTTSLSSGFGTLVHTTASFTPPNSSLLVVHCGVVNGANEADVRTGMTLSGGSLTWTLRVGPNGATVSDYTSCHEIWTAPVSTGASMTLVYAHAGDVGNDKSQALIQVHSYTSDTGSAEIGSANIATGAHDQGDASVTITLGSSPSTSSEVSASRYYSSDGGDGNATPATGWTEIYDETATDNGYGSLQSQIRGGSTSTSVSWDDVMTAPETAWNSSAQAVEVKEVAGGTTPHGPFGLPFHGPFGGPI